MANLNLNLNLFKTKKGVVLPQYLDDQLNDVVDYINEDLIPILEEIELTATNGVIGDKDALFSNVNNINTQYAFLNNINFDNNLLSFSKLISSNKGSIMISNWQTGEIEMVTPISDSLLLFGSFARGFSFRKITSLDLDHNVITGEKLGVLENNNFILNTFLNIIPNGHITEVMLSEVSNAKILDNSIDFRHIGVFLDLPYSAGIPLQLHLDDFDDNSILSNKIQDGTISWDNFISLTPITINKLVPMHITDSYLIPYVANTPIPAGGTIADFIASNFSAIINFPNIFVQNVRLTPEKIALGSVSKTHFNAEVRAAIDRCIQIRNLALVPPPQPYVPKPYVPPPPGKGWWEVAAPPYAAEMNALLARYPGINLYDANWRREHGVSQALWNAQIVSTPLAVMQFNGLA